MNITKEYLPDRGVVVVTVENPPLPTTKHTVTVESLADGRVNLEQKMAELRAEAEERLRVHEAVMRMMQ